MNTPAPPDLAPEVTSARPGRVQPVTNIAEVARHYRRQGRERRLRADLVDVGSVLFVVVPVALWLAQSGLAGFATGPGALRELGVLAGLVGTALVCLMLILAARIPVIDRAIGHDAALLRHRKLTAAAMSLLLVHGVLLVISYALAEQIGIAAEVVRLWGIEDFVPAVLALGLFALVGLTSMAAVKLRLPHEVWHGVHLVSYLAVLFSVPHQFSMSGLFAQGPARWYWAAMFALSFGALIVYRFGAPLAANLSHRVRVARVEPVTADTVNIHLTGRGLADLDALAGQFFSLRFLAKGLWWHPHPFSTSAAPSGDSLRFTVRALGRGTAALQRVRPGTPVLIQGPYGIFSDAARTRESVVMIGSGVGIAPIRALLEATRIVPGRAVVILRAGSIAECFLLDEIRELCLRRGAQLELLIGHRDPAGGWMPREHRGTIGDLVPWVAQADVFICGPDAHSAAVVEDLRRCAVPLSQIHQERFSW